MDDVSNATFEEWRLDNRLEFGDVEVRINVDMLVNNMLRAFRQIVCAFRQKKYGSKRMGLCGNEFARNGTDMHLKDGYCHFRK